MCRSRPRPDLHEGRPDLYEGRPDLYEGRRGLDDHMMIRADIALARMNTAFCVSKQETYAEKVKVIKQATVKSKTGSAYEKSYTGAWRTLTSASHLRRRRRRLLAVFCWVSLTSPRLQQWFDAEFGPQMVLSLHDLLRIHYRNINFSTRKHNQRLKIKIVFSMCKN